MEHRNTGVRGRSDRGEVAYASVLMEGCVGGVWIRQQVEERRVFTSEGNQEEVFGRRTTCNKDKRFLAEGWVVGRSK